MEWSELRRRLDVATAAVLARGPATVRVSIAPPATVADVDAAEALLGRELPESFRRAVLEFSADVDAFWFLPKGDVAPLKGVFSGVLSWSLPHLIRIDEVRQGMVHACFSNRRKAYDRIWQQAVAFENCGDGSMLGIGTPKRPDAVLFLSHDEARIHGWQLGASFDDYLERGSRVAFCGPEEWQLEHFLVAPNVGIDPDSAAARELRHWLGVDL